MKRRYGILALAVLSLLLLNLGWQYEPPQTPADAQASLRGVRQPQQAPAPPMTALMTRLTPAASGSQPTDPHPSWREMPQEMSQQLASEVGDSEQPLAERLANLSELESQWMSEGESLTRLQGRYAEALAQLASEGEQLTLAERLAALTRLQDEWAADHPDLAADLFNPDARLQQARQLWGDEELETLARHFLPADRAEASLAFAATRQQQLDQRGHYQQQLAELEQQLAASQGNMDPERWQQHREEVLGQFRRDFFAQAQGKP
ncbi:hypothetical protein OB959_09125 [Aeromonas bestiarum]|uniref:Lipase modulator n=1 Tax=Aeromonas bestiarum TaxID=105751 RepID=A0AAW7I989_9GAMM|nr:hypothetical protein [Aeromonas bestiarum]MDM5139962.1 hypothetical protein [Aeromonas bestiarum]